MINIQLLKKRLVDNTVFHYTVLPVYRLAKYFYTIPMDCKSYKAYKERIKNRKSEKRIYYLGVPAHANLGDLAQGVCIRRWIKKHYPDYELIEIETSAIVNQHKSIIQILAENYRDQDFILFQSGYTTTDLGGEADKMHCMVIQNMPDAHYVMMPQTIFFKSKKREQHTSTIYSSARHMLYLARDSVSYEKALSMFNNIAIVKYPDIVTSLIGTMTFRSNREGILFCCRDDDEKFYSDESIDRLIVKCKKFAEVKKTDTTKYTNTQDIVTEPEKWIMQEIESYSHYKLIVTDRYHGTIFALVSGTPVIILKTTDHKVTTGADWFKGIYDKYVYLADSLEDVVSLAHQILSENLDYNLNPYFEEKYYDQLPRLIDETFYGGKR